MKTLTTVLLLACLAGGRIVGTSYAEMNCSQFACRYTGHRPATAAQLYAEGSPGQPHIGDIVAFHGAHVAVLTPDGLMDSTPERGVALAHPAPGDAWYFGPVRIVHSGR